MRKLITLLIVVLLCPVIVLAAYDDIQLNSGSTLQVTVGGSTYDLEAVGDLATSLVVNAGNIEVTLASGGGFLRITSSNRTTYTYGAAFTSTFTCGTSSSVLELTGSGTEVITPTGTVCVVPTTGGGGGGTTTAVSETPTTTTTVETTTVETTPSAGEVAVVSEPVTTPSVTTPQVVTPQVQAISPVFSTGLKKGTENSDVERLQKLLASDSEIYPEGKITGYYGSLTEKAVQRFQMKYGVVSSASDPGYGYLGPKTRAKIEEVFSGVTEAVPTPAVAVSVSITLSRELDPGMSGSDVKALQEFLNSDPETRVADSGIGSPGSETEYYGALTAEAVKKFQAKYGISTVGRVGPQTLQKLNELMSASAPQSSVPSSSSVSETQDTSALQAQLLQATARLQELQQQLQSLLGQ